MLFHGVASCVVYCSVGRKEGRKEGRWYAFGMVHTPYQKRLPYRVNFLVWCMDSSSFAVVWYALVWCGVVCFGVVWYGVVQCGPSLSDPSAL